MKTRGTGKIDRGPEDWVTKESEPGGRETGKSGKCEQCGTVDPWNKVIEELRDRGTEKFGNLVPEGLKRTEEVKNQKNEEEWNGGIVEWWNSRMVEQWNGGTAEWRN